MGEKALAILAKWGWGILPSAREFFRERLLVFHFEVTKACMSSSVRGYVSHFIQWPDDKIFKLWRPLLKLIFLVFVVFQSLAWSFGRLFSFWEPHCLCRSRLLNLPRAPQGARGTLEGPPVVPSSHSHWVGRRSLCEVSAEDGLLKKNTL